MVFESTSMRYETLVARFWLRVRGVPQSSSRRLSCAKEKSSGVENVIVTEILCVTILWWILGIIYFRAVSIETERGTVCIRLYSFILSSNFKPKYTEHLKMEMKTNLSVHLFNCDNTFELDSVESLFTRVIRSELDFNISIDKHYFRLSQMSVMSDKTVPGLQMNLAVFVVHAHESRLSINEDGAGIGYAKIYRALKHATGESLNRESKWL